MGEKRQADIFQAAVQGGAGAMARSGKFIDALADKGYAKMLIIGLKLR